MPTKQEIEAELQLSETDRIRAEFERLIGDVAEMEDDLREREKAAGLPSFYQSKPLVERMAAVGMSREAIARVSEWLEAMGALVMGKGAELPEHIKKELGEQADAALSGAQQLAAIVAVRHGKR
jgi:hypothetical protein